MSRNVAKELLNASNYMRKAAKGLLSDDDTLPSTSGSDSTAAQAEGKLTKQTMDIYSVQ